MALSLVQNHFGGRSDAAYFYAILEVVSMRKLKKYKPTRFMAKTSHYDKDVFGKIEIQRKGTKSAEVVKRREPLSAPNKSATLRSDEN